VPATTKPARKFDHNYNYTLISAADSFKTKLMFMKYNPDNSCSSIFRQCWLGQKHAYVFPEQARPDALWLKFKNGGEKQGGGGEICIGRGTGLEPHLIKPLMYTYT
jgi:hypothetical protein